MGCQGKRHWVSANVPVGAGSFQILKKMQQLYKKISKFRKILLHFFGVIVYNY